LKLTVDPVLRARVQAKLVDKLSPRTIALQLRTEGLFVSAETIYRACYHPDGPLGNDAHRQLCRPRRGRHRRRRTTTGRDPQPLGQIRSVHNRQAALPQEAGHWEGDLLVGKQNRTVIAVLTERNSRLVQLIALPEGRNTRHVTSRIAHTLDTVPPPLRRSLTWDQGRELTAWPQLEKQIGIPIYFCDPRSPWQKPLVENVCGLLRRWLPRTQPMPTNQQLLDYYAQLLNTMPRRSLGDTTAQNRYDQLRVATTM
jgi:IS30 family transposase